MKKKHQKTLDAIFKSPVQAGIVWKDVEAMLITLGATIEEAEGSRVFIMLNNAKATFHRPHPRKETDKGAVKNMRKFLTEAGVK